MKCIILAGGFATRLWPLTEAKAKPLLHLKDKPLISHIVEKLPNEVDIIVSTNAAFAEEFNNWAKDYEGKSIKIFVEDSMDDDFKKGALGATAFVIKEEKIDEDLMLIAGDNYFGFKMEDFIGHFKGNPMLAAYDIKELEKAKKFGVVVKQEGKVIGFQEKPENPASTLVSTGCYVFPQKNLTDIVDYAIQHNDDLGGVFEYLLTKGEEIDVFGFSEEWVDIGSFDAYLQANIDLIGNQVIKQNEVTDEGNNFLGSVFLGKRSVIKNSTLENVIILNDCLIDNCVIKNSVIDEKATLRNLDLSYKMIRRKSVIEK